MKLLCVPYAGATSMNYLQWKKHFNADIQLIPLDPPGRGRRITEACAHSIDEAIQDMVSQIHYLLDPNEDYALYGHSMGSLLIYELLHQLKNTTFNIPAHVFLSGRNPPQYPIPLRISHLNDPEFITEILKYGGTPEGFFENKQLADLFLPILRADYKMVEDYVYVEKEKLPVDITYFYSSEDAGISLDWINRWKELITGDFNIYTFRGAHFFIFEHAKEISSIMNNVLNTKNKHHENYIKKCNQPDYINIR